MAKAKIQFALEREMTAEELAQCIVDSIDNSDAIDSPAYVLKLVSGVIGDDEETWEKVGVEAAKALGGKFLSLGAWNDLQDKHAAALEKAKSAKPAKPGKANKPSEESAEA